ncbi:hypothetical protein JCM19046_21 [Bacillus sp. JCM 19046]|nr:hypothetical protein JCM19046_21 [Bacillus sp. JCM 19046]
MYSRLFIWGANAIIELHKKRRSIFFIGFSSLGLIIIMMIPVQSSLVFYKENTNTILAHLPLNANDHFNIVYTHSIHLTDVTEHYVVTDDYEIKQTEMSFSEFGIGMPSYATGDQELVFEKDEYHLRNINTTHAEIAIRTGYVVPEQRLVWGNDAENQIWFKDHFELRSWITMKVDYLSLWQWLKGEQLNGNNE